MASSIPWSTSPIIVANPFLFTREEIELYEGHILADPSTTEHGVSTFFAAHPKFLLMGSGAEIRREVVLNSGIGKSSQRVDFFRRNFGSAYWDLVELKSPQKEFVVSDRTGHPALSASVYKAISQAEDYRDMIVSDSDLRNRLLALGIAVCRPQITVVVGKDHESVPDDVMAALYDRVRRGPINAYTYNDLYRFAKEHYESNMILLTSALLVESNRIVRFGGEELQAILSENGNRAIISLGTRNLVDSSLIDMFGDDLSEFLESHSSREIVLDFASTEFMASATLSKLISGRQRARKNDKELVLSGLRPELLEVFKITRLDRLFRIEDLKSRQGNK